MNRKVILVLLILGLGSFMILFVLLRILPDTGASMLNEISLTIVINNDKVKRIKKNVNRIQEILGTGSSPRIRQAKKHLALASQVTDSVSGWVDHVIANADESLPETVNEKTVMENSIDDLRLTKQIIPILQPITQISESDNYNLKVLQVENIRAEAYDRIQIFIDSIMYQNESSTIQFGSKRPIPGTNVGLISFNPPASMELEQRYRIQVKIAKEMRDNIMKELSRGQATIDSLLVGEIMIVRLVGDDFTITSLDEEEQGVLDVGYTQWEFDITPLRPGERSLYIKAGIMYHVPNLGPTKKFFPVFEKQVKIKVSYLKRMGNFVTQRWDFLLSSFVIPLLMWGYTEVRKRRRATARKKMRSSNTESNDTIDPH